MKVPFACIHGQQGKSRYARDLGQEAIYRGVQEGSYPIRKGRVGLTCMSLGQNPASTAALDAPTAPPSMSASSYSIWKFSALFRALPPAFNSSTVTKQLTERLKAVDRTLQSCIAFRYQWLNIVLMRKVQESSAPSALMRQTAKQRVSEGYLI